MGLLIVPLKATKVSLTVIQAALLNDDGLPTGLVAIQGRSDETCAAGFTHLRRTSILPDNDLLRQACGDIPCPEKSCWQFFTYHVYII